MQKLGELTENLKTQVEERNAEAERSFHETLTRLNTSLTQSVHDELRTITSAMARDMDRLRARQLDALDRSWHRAALLSLIILAVLALTSFALGFGASLILNGRQQRIREYSRQIEQQKQTLETAKSWGIQLHQDSNGRFIVLPKGITPNTRWSWDGRPAIKLEE